MLVSYLGWIHIYRTLNDRHFCGYNDHRIGLSIREITELEAKVLKEVNPEEYNKAYNQQLIDSFNNLPFETILEWVERGN